MNTINPNDPAFPLIANGPNYEKGYDGFKPGLSIRAEIASRCMTALIPKWGSIEDRDAEFCESMAQKAVQHADALIAELNKQYS